MKKLQTLISDLQDHVLSLEKERDLWLKKGRKQKAKMDTKLDPPSVLKWKKESDKTAGHHCTVSKALYVLREPI
jgi:hypothetical protein